MANYFVGDLHGCFDELQALLKQVNFDVEKDHLYLTGDLIARGDKSLECLRFVKSLGNHGHTVLGNHDLHLLATAQGIKRVKARDNVDALFNAPDFKELIDWLRFQPMLIHLAEQNILLAHAGISPDWDLTTAINCAKEVECILQQDNFSELLENMYQNQPDLWSNTLTGIERLRYSINSLTRMRFCYLDHRLDFDCKLSLQDAPEDLVPWFSLDNPLYKSTNIIFGHWASLVDNPIPQGIYALDTGCVWGNRLTMIRWEDKAIFTQESLKSYQC